jgi:hypothetical protein
LHGQTKKAKKQIVQFNKIKKEKDYEKVSDDFDGMLHANDDDGTVGKVLYDLFRL